ncbi:MAG: Mur ligase family protein [Candidatus Moduliflexus flocculans]|nr:Mur ligase family protein [Candidatus Moduliflexus flocculans]
MTISPNVAAILNITPNHLDRHGTMEAYAAAKARILEFQSTE